MPNGKTHDKITMITAPLVVGFTYLMIGDIKTTLILMAAYFFASFMFNGDLDTNSRPYNRWWLFKMIWIPYQLMFTHRSIWTHGIVLGTVVRLLYVLAIPVLVIAIKGVGMPEMNWSIVLPVLIGLELGNLNHSVSDKIF